MIGYSARAARALRYLFRPFNDIDVFIEDKNCRNAYETLLQRILRGRARVSRVFPLGSWQEVVEKCRSAQDENGRPRLFIIDGDFRLLAGESPPEFEALYQLGVYSCENLLFCFEAVVEVAFDSVAGQTREEIKASLALPEFEEICAEPLYELFIMYAVAHALGSGEKTSSVNIQNFCEVVAKEHRLAPEKVRARRLELRETLAKEFGEEQVIERELAIRTHIANESLEYRHIVSGKTYLLPLLHNRLKRRVGYRGDLVSLRNSLARHCSLEVDPLLVRRVELAAQAV